MCIIRIYADRDVKTMTTILVESENYELIIPSRLQGESRKIYTEILELCNRASVSISRWQYNKSLYNSSIHYAIHTGERESQFRWQKNIICSIELSSETGKTKRSQTYQSFESLKEDLEKYLANAV